MNFQQVAVVSLTLGSFGILDLGFLFLLVKSDQKFATLINTQLLLMTVSYIIVEFSGAYMYLNRGEVDYDEPTSVQVLLLFCRSRSMRLSLPLLAKSENNIIISEQALVQFIRCCFKTYERDCIPTHYYSRSRLSQSQFYINATRSCNRWSNGPDNIHF